VVALAGVLRHLEAVTVGPAVTDDVRHGKVMGAERLDVRGSGPWSILDPEGNLLAVYHDHGHGRVKPAVVLMPA
jgi:hypothetical protein